MSKDYRMTFGIHAGKLLINVPMDYLIWCTTTKDCPYQIKNFLKKSPGMLTMTEEDYKVAKGPRHAYFKGYFTEEAIIYREAEEKRKAEEIRLEELRKN